ncbi:MAG: DUF6527 family protein [Thiofilum sp.]|uniref:DUF6527 family protein n=1 Tax=Thiofilum sp. TaxID=2212733 RepID=UPI0025FD1DC9|nr:DUF6527 family protein [Thiofilum sp.]MBK8455080.1 hypothetical protein [Thiofilum sp.]
MSRIDRLQHRFVNSFPDNPESGVLYIALDFVTMSHLCCCGCGQEVITPLSPNDWKMIFDGQSITLHPSIGNWSLPCRSHYFIQNGKVQWASDWSDEQIRNGREKDLIAKRKIVNTPLKVELPSTQSHNTITQKKGTGLWASLIKWLFRE